MSDQRISYISILQIIGPIFVVLGHSLNGLEYTGVYYTFSKEWIYIFHMPLFFMISGYLLAYRGYKRSYGELVLEKSKRLLIPYFVWNLVFCIPKIFAQRFITDDAASNLFDVMKAFVFPRQNIWGHTWFLVGLFVVYLSAPLLKKALGMKKSVTAVVLALCTVLYIMPITSEFLAFSDIHKDLLFFAVGCLLGQMEYDKFIYVMKRLRVFFIGGAILFSFAALLCYEQTKMLHFIPCMFILLALLSISVSVKKLPAFFERIASYSFAIYIMHWPVMIVVRILLHQILDAGIGLTAAAMIISGYLVPVIVIAIIRALPFEKVKKPLKYLLGV